MNTKWALGFVAVAAGWVCLAGPPPAARAADAVLDKYFNANALCRRGLYPLAAKEYEAFLSASRTHAKAPQA